MSIKPAAICHRLANEHTLKMLSLANKRIVITGGASGIGRAIAKKFAEHQAEVNILDYDSKLAKSLVNEIRSHGGNAHSYRCNVADHEQVQMIFKTIGDINVLVNNASVNHLGTADTTCEEDFDWLMGVNIKGVYNCLHAALPLIRNCGGGAIVNISSIAASIGQPRRFAYTTTKGAITAMTLSVACDYQHENIRCNSISPSRMSKTETAQQVNENVGEGTSNRHNTLEEIAKLALYLCSDQATFITGNDYRIVNGVVIQG